MGGSNNSIIGNYISFNIYGLYLGGSNNKIFHNNFINNTHQAGDGMFNLSWNDTYPFGGNYWSDYEGSDLYSGPTQDINGSDGIGDVPYYIDYNSIDYYPLKTPWNISQIPPSISSKSTQELPWWSLIIIVIIIVFVIGLIKSIFFYRNKKKQY